MHDEYDNISCQEFRQLLSGINGDTPLGYTVKVRSEKNPKILKEMTVNDKKIRQEWREFTLHQKKDDSRRIYLKNDEISKTLSKMFN